MFASNPLHILSEINYQKDEEMKNTDLSSTVQGRWRGLKRALRSAQYGFPRAIKSFHPHSSHLEVGISVPIFRGVTPKLRELSVCHRLAYLAPTSIHESARPKGTATVNLYSHAEEANK